MPPQAGRHENYDLLDLLAELVPLLWLALRAAGCLSPGVFADAVLAAAEVVLAAAVARASAGLTPVTGVVPFGARIRPVPVLQRPRNPRAATRGRS